MKPGQVMLVCALGIFLKTTAVAARPVFDTPRVYKLDLTYQKIWHNSDPMISDISNRDWGDAVGLETAVEAGRFYFEANPHFESAYGKVMTVGLLFHTGFQVFDWLDLEYTHHSRHTADRTNDYNKEGGVKSGREVTAYPLWDSYGVRVHFIVDYVRSRK